MTLCTAVMRPWAREGGEMTLCTAVMHPWAREGGAMLTTRLSMTTLKQQLGWEEGAKAFGRDTTMTIRVTFAGQGTEPMTLLLVIQEAMIHRTKILTTLVLQRAVGLVHATPLLLIIAPLRVALIDMGAIQPTTVIPTIPRSMREIMMLSPPLAATSPRLR